MNIYIHHMEGYSYSLNRYNMYNIQLLISLLSILLLFVISPYERRTLQIKKGWLIPRCKFFRLFFLVIVIRIKRLYVSAISGWSNLRRTKLARLVWSKKPFLCKEIIDFFWLPRSRLPTVPRWGSWYKGILVQVRFS